MFFHLLNLHAFFALINMQYFILSIRTTIEQLNNEINALDKRISTLKRQIELPSTEDDIKLQMAEFMRVRNLKTELKLIN